MDAALARRLEAAHARGWKKDDPTQYPILKSPISITRQGRLGLLLGGVIPPAMTIFVIVTGIEGNFQLVACDGDR